MIKNMTLSIKQSFLAAAMMTASLVILSGCTLNDAGHLLYNSAVSSQKFQCEEDKVGNSIEACKRNIDNATNTQPLTAADEGAQASGYEPKDYVKKQLQKRTNQPQY